MITTSINWLNENRYRSYPFKDDVNMIVSGPDGNINISNGVLLDFQLINYTVPDANVGLQKFEVIAGTPKTVKFTFICYNNTSNFTYDMTVPTTADFPYKSVKSSDYEYMSAVVFGYDIAGFETYTVGEYIPEDPILILKSLMCQQDKHLVKTLSGDATGSEILEGHVYFEEGYNCSIYFNYTGNTVRIGASLGAGKGISCEVLENSRNLDDVIYFINGVNPDSSGNINIVSYEGFNIYKQDDTLVIESDLATNDIKCE